MFFQGQLFLEVTTSMKRQVKMRNNTVQKRFDRSSFSSVQV